MNGITKTCATCQRDLPASDYYADKSRKDGLNRICKSCNAERSRAYYAANREVQRAASKAWGEANRERRREIDRAKYLRTRDKRLTQMKQWAANNPHRDKGYKQAWRDRDPEAFKAARRAIRLRRRAREVAATSIPYTQAELLARVAFYGGRCWICRGPFDHLDHVKPLAKGGPHMLANLRPACARCNTSKGDRWPYSPASAPVS